MNVFLVVFTFCLHFLLINEYCSADETTQFQYIGNKLVYISDVKVRFDDIFIVSE